MKLLSLVEQRIAQKHIVASRGSVVFVKRKLFMPHKFELIFRRTSCTCVRLSINWCETQCTDWWIKPCGAHRKRLIEGGVLTFNLSLLKPLTVHEATYTKMYRNFRKHFRNPYLDVWVVPEVSYDWCTTGCKTCPPAGHRTTLGERLYSGPQPFWLFWGLLSTAISESFSEYFNGNISDSGASAMTFCNWRLSPES